MAKFASVEWREGRHYEGVSAGHAVQMDSAAPRGTDLGMSPMALVLVALGGCTAIDVVDILTKEHQELTGLKVEVSGAQAPEPPNVYTHLRITYIVRGHALKREAVERAVRLSEEKYCSVGAMLAKTAEIETVIEISEDMKPAREGANAGQ
jgi:putative redox protein